MAQHVLFASLYHCKEYANTIFSPLPPLLQPVCYSACTLVSQGYDASVARRLWTVTSNQLWWSPCFCTDMQLWQGSASDRLFWSRPETCRSICSVGRRRAGSWKPRRTVIQYLLVGRMHRDTPCWRSEFLTTPPRCPPRFLTVFRAENILRHTHRKGNWTNKQLIRSKQSKWIEMIKQHIGAN